ncbi:MAG: glycine--tRNA ligase subunit beta [Pseudomonadota bacterium]
MPDLLIELFSEEIPARMQRRAAHDLKRLVTDGLVDAGLTYASAGAFSTPRRLTLSVEGLLAASPDLREERKGPRADAPEKAIEGFLRGAGLTRDQVEERETPKGAVLFATIEKPGRLAAEIVAEVLANTIRNFPWPKSMRWGGGPLRWVRPLQSILCILTDEAGAEIVSLDIDGIASGDTTEGHRFMAPGRFVVGSFDDYVAKLKKAHVVLDPAERADAIWHDATNLAFAQGLEVVEDAGLLHEVAGLVEWPVVLMGNIGPDYLELPPEVLQTSMKEHQKFFSVRDKSGRIVKFFTVANRETADNGATILAGNEKVLGARLADAKFFWENDLRTIANVGLEGMAAPLANVTFHNKLGSQADRIKRIEALARKLAPLVGAKPDLAAEAARVCKADLASEMVYEFPELQGIMGRYYAEAAGHDDGVPEACDAHYSPLGPSDDVPVDPVSIAVALADKIDLLMGFWSIDEKPTGSKDPFALRRAALGVIRILLGEHPKPEAFEFEKVRPLAARIRTEGEVEAAVSQARGDLENLIETEKELGELEAAFGQRSSDRFYAARFHEVSSKAAGTLDGGLDQSARNAAWMKGVLDEIGSMAEEAFMAKTMNLTEDLLGFLHDRLKVYLRDQGIRHDIIDACIAMPGNDDIALLAKRAQALQATIGTDDGENLIQGFKRANNILTQAEEADGVEYSFGADPKFAETDEERALFAALDAAEARINPAMQQQDFATAMHAMAGLRGPIDAFFEAVKINDDNQTIRRNRLNLLSRIRSICLGVADLTRIEG